MVVGKGKAYFKGLSRKDYVQKAHELIQREGVEAVSIRRIAKEMGCSSASLYRYFDDLSELLYYAELRTLNSYIKRLNQAEKGWKGAWDVYVGVWDCYSREAFSHPEAFELLFFKYTNEKLQSSIREYYEMFPGDLEETSRIFQEMLRCADFLGRDYEMCKRCVQEGVLRGEDAGQLNRMACNLFKGYFKTVLDEGIEEEQIDARVKDFIDDMDMVVRALAVDLKGYTGYKRN